MTAFEPSAELVALCVRRWGLTLLPPFENLSYHYVAPVLCADGTEAVLKIGSPGIEQAREAAALRVYDGQNCVRLLDADLEHGVLLLERLCPGTTLTLLADDQHDTQATSIAASVMRGLRCPVPPGHDFPTVADWGEGFARLRARFSGGTGPLPSRLVAEAETLFAELLASSAAPVLLHGDLHHDNILAGRDAWLAIDPKGLVGEPAYEAGALLRNFWRDRHTLSDPKRLAKRRMAQLAEELGFDQARIRGWAVAQAVLSAWWCLEDGVDCWESAIADAEILAGIG